MKLHCNPYMLEEGYFLNCADPGGATGMSLFHVKPKSFQLVTYETVKYDPHGSGSMPTSVLIEWKLTYPGVHHLLYEDFHARNNDSAKDLTALRVIGSIDQMIHERKLYEEIFQQEPVAAKFMVTDDVLEKLDLHMGNQHSQRHVRDANRHFVSHMSKLRYRPICEAAYPRGGGVTNPRIRPGSRP
jgi:hypothetical protein